MIGILGLAPSTPASHEPSVLTTLPCLISLEFSPKYRMLPSLSWACQSKVSSTNYSSIQTLALSTAHSTPITRLVPLVTLTSMCSKPSASFPL